MQRLLDAGVMQIVAVTDPLQLGLPPAGDDRRPGRRATSRDVADKLAALPEVDYVVITAGSFDILVELVCEDDDHLLALLNDSIRAVPGVRNTETFVYLQARQADLRLGNAMTHPTPIAMPTTQQPARTRPAPPVDALHPDVARTPTTTCR